MKGNTKAEHEFIQNKPSPKIETYPLSLATLAAQLRSRSGRVLIRIKGEAARSIRSRGIVLFPDHGVKMIKSDRPSWAGKNLYIWSRSDPRQGTNGFADLFTFMARIYGTNVRSGAYVKV